MRGEGVEEKRLGAYRKSAESMAAMESVEATENMESMENVESAENVERMENVENIESIESAGGMKGMGNMGKSRDGKWKKRMHLPAAVLAMLFLVISLLLTSFQVAIYGDGEYRFYEKEYVKYNVTEALSMELADVMVVTEYMMDYLIGREEILSIETDVDGRRQDFFNEQDRLHMADVKGLFLGGLKLRTALFLGALFLAALLAAGKVDLGKVLLQAYGIAMAVFAAAFVFLRICFTVDFTRCFTIFHRMFFTNDLWIFDESTDYMIRMLPEGFFSDMVIRIALVFAGSLVCLGIGVGLGYILRHRNAQRGASREDRKAE